MQTSTEVQEVELRCSKRTRNKQETCLASKYRGQKCKRAEGVGGRKYRVREISNRKCAILVQTATSSFISSWVCA